MRRFCQEPSPADREVCNNAWRQRVVVAMVVALAIWGFRNVLGKQSAFPAGTLDG